MVAVLTGDIVASKIAQNPDLWMRPLKSVLNRMGKSPKTWEIYRGDSFQLQTDPSTAIAVALEIKAVIKSTKGLDVRLAIGIGEKQHDAPRITESSGDALIFSGQTFDRLEEEKRTLMIRSPWSDLDESLNLMLRLLLIPIDQWTPASAEIAAMVLANPDKSQQELATELNISQSSVSARYNRAHLREVLEFIAYSNHQIAQKTAMA